jgi:DNA-binding PadR family transcriptional regulator
MTIDSDVRDLLPLTDLAFDVLLTLSGEELHGYALVKGLREHQGRSNLRTGTVYAALARLQGDGLVTEVPRPRDAESEDARRRYYRVTERGHAVARAEASRLQDLLERAVREKLLPSPGGG